MIPLSDKNYFLLDEFITKSWKNALIKAEYETEIDSSQFPECCPWAFSQFINDDFWPDADEPEPAKTAK